MRNENLTFANIRLLDGKVTRIDVSIELTTETRFAPPHDSENTHEISSHEKSSEI
jgi:hypothetical protein